MLDTLANMATIIASATVIIGSIWVASSFKYKHDSDVRNLYLKNFEKVWDVSREFWQKGTYSPEMHNKITEAFVEAKVYLHKDIVSFIEDIRCKLIEQDSLNTELQAIPVGKERSKKVHEQANLKKYIHDKTDNIHNLYRKHLIEEPFKRK